MAALSSKAGYGRVVNTVSEAMLGGIPELTSYGAAKGAVFELTRNLATENRHGIRVNAIAPRPLLGCPRRTQTRWRSYMSMPKEVDGSSQREHAARNVRSRSGVPAHESCPLNGEILQVGMGGVSRIAVVHTPGIAKSPLTAEDIAENLDRVMDPSEATSRSGS